MLIQSFNQELQYANIMFGRIFKNITIDKTINGKRTSHRVKCVYGNSSRILKNLINPTKRATYSYPLISIMRTGIARDPERVSNLHNEIVRSASRDKINYNLLAPNPINIEYAVSIISDLPSDIDLILGNFIPFFNSDLFVTSKHPKFAGLTYNSQIIMNDAITEEHPEELTNDVSDVTIATVNFTYKTYIFGGSDRAYAGEHDLSGTTYKGFVPTVNALCMEFHAVPLHDVTNISAVVPYDFNKYWNDIETGAFPDPDYDVMSWFIDEDGVLVQENAIHKNPKNA